MVASEVWRGTWQWVKNAYRKFGYMEPKTKTCGLDGFYFDPYPHGGLRLGDSESLSPM